MHFDVAGVYHQPLEIRLFYEHLEELFPNPLVPPTDEAPMGISPTAQIRRQIPPRRPSAQDPKHGIDKLAVVFGVASPRSRSSRQVWLQQVLDSLPDVVMPVDRIHADTIPPFLSRDYSI